MQVTDLIADAKTAMLEYQAAADVLKGVILGQAFVLRCGAMCLAFDIDREGRLSNPRAAHPHQAHRFTRMAAARLAPSIKNGNGTPAEAVHVRTAIADALEAQRALLASLEAHASRATHQFDLAGQA